MGTTGAGPSGAGSGPDEDLSDERTVFERRHDIQIVDVREPHEWKAGHIDGAIHVPLAQLMSSGVDLDPDRPVVAVCKMGNRSEVASLMLQARGYQAHNLRGGMEAWAGSDLPIVAEDDGPPRVV